MDSTSISAAPSSGRAQSYFYPYSGTGTFLDDEFRYVPHLEFGAPGEYLTDRLTDEAIKVIDYAGDRQFFLYLAEHAPHLPMEAKPDDVRYFRDKLAKIAPDRSPTYAAMVRSIDDNFARLMTHLRERGIARQTIVIFFSDNGGQRGIFWDHARKTARRRKYSSPTMLLCGAARERFTKAASACR